MSSSPTSVLQYQRTGLTILSNVVVLAYSLFILACPFLKSYHCLPQALQINKSARKSISNGRQVQQIIYVTIFNILICLFNIFAIIIPYQKCRRIHLLSIFAALFLAVSNFLLAMLLINLKSILVYLNLPENILIYKWNQYSHRGNINDFTCFFYHAIIVAFVICVPATIYNAAFWKQHFTLVLKNRIKNKNLQNKNQFQSNRQQSLRQTSPN